MKISVSTITRKSKMKVMDTEDGDLFLLNSSAHKDLVCINVQGRVIGFHPERGTYFWGPDQVNSSQSLINIGTITLLGDGESITLMVGK